MGGEGKPELSREEWLRRVMEREREARPVMEWVMCPTCCGFVWRKKRSAMPYPDDAGEVLEMLADSKEMRAAVMPKLVMEPDAATEILRMRTRMMLEHERCPTCYRPLSDTLETKPCKEDKMVAAVETMGADSGSKRMVEMVAGDETMNKRLKENKGSKVGKNKKKRSKKNKKKRSKNKNKRSTEEPRGGEKWKMVASEGEAMVADLGSREDSEYSMGCTRKSSSESPEYPMGRTEKSSSESNEYYTRLTGKSSSEYSTGLTGKSSSEGSEYSMGPNGKRRTKMVTCRLSKEFVQQFIQTHSSSPFTHMTNNHIRSLLSRQIAEYEVECELHAYWQSQCDMKGYAEYQEEVTDYEDA